jgi:hypothetical protein
MNYAIIGPQGGVNRVTDKEPQNVAEGATVVEISENQAQQIRDGLAATPRVFFVYKDGEFLTREQWREQQIAARPKPLVTAEKHIEREGYPAIRLVTLIDLEGKLAQAGKTSAKLTAARSWLDSILGAFASNPEPRNDWPSAPFGFEETVQDAASKL